MTHTARTQEIDGHTIIRGFDFLQRDPEGTKARVREIIEESEEYIRFREILDDLERMKRAPVTPELLAAINEGGEEASKLSFVLAEQKKELLELIVVTFEPRANEVILSDEEYEILQAKYELAGQNRSITVDGKEIDDCVGVQYWIQDDDGWTHHVAREINTPLPDGAKTLEMLNSSEREIIEKMVRKEQIARLPKEEREKMKHQELSNLIFAAAQMRSGFEIMGESNPLQRSKDWYQARSEEIEELYEVG